MFEKARQDEILALLNMRRSATVTELANELYVSEATIRRDLRDMAQNGLLQRTHGGAMVLLGKAEESALAMRETVNVGKKRIIANLCLPLFANNQTVFFDASSTVGVLIPLLKRVTRLTAITTGLQNALLLSSMGDAKVYVAGGQVQNHSGTVLGATAQAFLSTMHADLAVLSATGFDLNNGITEWNIEQAAGKRMLAANAQRVILLVDSDKFGKTCLCEDFPLHTVDTLITDTLPNEAYQAKIKEAGCKLICPTP